MKHPRLSQLVYDTSMEAVSKAFEHKEQHGMPVGDLGDLAIMLMREDGADPYNVFVGCVNEYFLRHPSLSTAWNDMSASERIVVAHDLFFGIGREITDETKRHEHKICMDIAEKRKDAYKQKTTYEINEYEKARMAQAMAQSDVNEVFRVYEEDSLAIANFANTLWYDVESTKIMITDGDGVDHEYEQYPIHRAIENLAEQSKHDEYDDAMKVIE